MTKLDKLYAIHTSVLHRALAPEWQDTVLKATMVVVHLLVEYANSYKHAHGLDLTCKPHV